MEPLVEAVGTSQYDEVMEYSFRWTRKQETPIEPSQLRSAVIVRDLQRVSPDPPLASKNAPPDRHIF
jgi:hypothetical protein